MIPGVVPNKVGRRWFRYGSPTVFPSQGVDSKSRLLGGRTTKGKRIIFYFNVKFFGSLRDKI